jgi:hypothetical protein
MKGLKSKIYNLRKTKISIALYLMIISNSYYIYIVLCYCNYVAREWGTHEMCCRSVYRSMYQAFVIGIAPVNFLEISVVLSLLSAVLFKRGEDA